MFYKSYLARQCLFLRLFRNYRYCLSIRCVCWCSETLRVNTPWKTDIPPVGKMISYFLGGITINPQFTFACNMRHGKHMLHVARRKKRHISLFNHFNVPQHSQVFCGVFLVQCSLLMILVFILTHNLSKLVPSLQ